MSARLTCAAGRRISTCEQCGVALPLRESVVRTESRTWLCGSCGQKYDGELDPAYTLDELRNVRPEPVVFIRSLLTPPSQQLLESAERLRLLPDHDGHDKRRSQRYAVSANIATQPLDLLLEPVDCPFLLVARNISAGGICLLNDQEIRTRFLALELAVPTGGFVQVLVHVIRNRPRFKIFEIGGEFITKMAIPNPRTTT